MLALWLGLGLLASSSDTPPTPPTVGGGGKFEHAHEDWERRQKWKRAAEQFLAEPAEVVAVESVTQPAQDALQRPRTATAALPQPVMPVAFDSLLLRAGELPVAQLLRDAMLRRMQDDMVQAALEAEMAIAAEDEAVGVLMIFMGMQ